jgi:phosphatidylethanolamine/phosphatidyl-N-methylethanolamine N-methyltransferase
MSVNGAARPGRNGVLNGHAAPAAVAAGDRREGGPRGPRKDAHESTLYHRFAHLYDRFFAPVYVRGLRRTIRALRLPAGARVLELGVGTGLSLAAYPAGAEVVGIDYSEAMLEEARKRVVRSGLRNVRLERMSACELGFPDDSFDFVLAFHVVTVVPDSEALMREALRVLRPGGRLVIVNRFRREKGWMAGVERRLEPLWKRCGWRTLSRGELLNGHPVEVLAAEKDSATSLFTTVVVRKPDPARNGSH